MKYFITNRIPWATYHGIPILQHRNALPLIGGMLQREVFTLIVELGTGKGGFTRFLADHAQCRIVSYDIRTRATVPGVVCRTADVFVPETCAEIRAELAAAGRALLICDDGNKPREVRTYAPLLRPGDMLMVHDYARTRLAFRREIRGRTWNWCEVVARDVLWSLPAGALKSYTPHLFAPVAWGVFLRT